MKELDIVAEMFATRVCNPLEWFGHARSLIAAARSTVERAELFNWLQVLNFKNALDSCITSENMKKG